MLLEEMSRRSRRDRRDRQWQAVVRRATALLQDDLDDSGGDGARIARRRVDALLNRIPEEARHGPSHMRRLRRRLNALNLQALNLQSLYATGMEKLNMLVREAAGFIASWRERAHDAPSALARRLLSHAPTPCVNRTSSITLSDLTEPYVRIRNHDNLCFSREEAYHYGRKRRNQYRTPIELQTAICLTDFARTNSVDGECKERLDLNPPLPPA